MPYSLTRCQPSDPPEIRKARLMLAQLQMQAQNVEDRSALRVAMRPPPRSDEERRVYAKRDNGARARAKAIRSYAPYWVRIIEEYDSRRAAELADAQRAALDLI